MLHNRYNAIKVEFKRKKIGLYRNWIENEIFVGCNRLRDNDII